MTQQNRLNPLIERAAWTCERGANNNGKSLPMSPANRLHKVRSGHSAPLAWSAALALIYLGLLSVTIALTSPGRMSMDELDMFGQAQSGTYHDWHAPLISWVWRIGLMVTPGALSIHVLGVSLYFLGWYLIAFELLAGRRFWTMWVVAFMSVFPPTWMGLTNSGNKDALLSAILLLSLGVAARMARVGWRPILIAAELLLITIALALRQNALFAVAPVVAFLFYPVISKRLHSVYSALIAVCLIAGATTLVLFVTTTAAVHFSLHVQRTNAIAILYLFDIAGTSARVGVDVTGGALGTEFAADMPRCYDPGTADNYATYGQCHQTWARMFDGIIERPGDVEKKSQLSRLWLNAVMAHPVAYLRHRVAHYLRTTGWTVPLGWPSYSLALDFQNPPGDLRKFPTPAWAMDRASTWLVTARFMQPYVWLIAGVIGLLAVLFHARSPAGALAALSFTSALGYGFGYLLVGVATSFRYFHWVIIADMVGFVWLVVGMLEQRALQSSGRTWELGNAIRMRADGIAG
jgi:hypothetical protein